MPRQPSPKNRPIDNDQLEQHLIYLKLPTIQSLHQSLAQQAAGEGWTHQQYLEKLISEEALQRQQRARERRIRQAHFPTPKTLEQFNWQWPTSINEMAVKQLFRLQFVKNKANVIFLGGVGMGKTHLSIALGYQACLGNPPIFNRS